MVHKSEKGTSVVDNLESNIAKSFEQQLLETKLDRAKRLVEIGISLEKVEKGEKLEKQERLKLAYALEGRGYQRILTQVKPGEFIINFSSPEVGPHTVKNLNDVHLGPSNTDKVIYDIVQRALLESIREVMKEKETDQQEKKIKMLEFPFKTKIFKCKPEHKDLIQTVTKKAEQKVQKEEIKLVNEKIRLLEEQIKDLPDSDKKNELIKQKKEYEKTLEAFKDHPYKLTYGLAEVGETSKNGDYTNVELALSQAINASKVEKDQTGGEFDYEVMIKKINKAQAILNKYTQDDSFNNILIDKNGKKYIIFKQREDGKFDVEKHLLQKIRKNELKLESQSTFEGIKRDLERYKILINSLDIVKPYTHEELSGEENLANGEPLTQRLTRITKAINVLRGFDENGKPLGDETSDQELDQLIQNHKETILELKKSEKDLLRTSDIKYHTQALRIENCTYISVDIKDVGPDLVNGFGQYFQEVDLTQSPEDIKAKIDEIIIKDGDDTTKRMRIARAQLAEILEKKGIPLDQQLMKLGGDEIELAIDSSQVTPELLLEINQQLGARVIDVQVAGKQIKNKATVAAASRFNGEHDPFSDENIYDHLTAEQRSEKGTKIAKEIEGFINEIYLSKFTDIKSDKFKSSETLSDFMHKFKEIISDNRLKIFSVMYKNESSDFIIIHKDSPKSDIREYTKDQFIKKIENLMQKIND